MSTSKSHYQIMLETIDDQLSKAGVPHQTEDAASDTLFRIMNLCEEVRRLRDENVTLRGQNESLRKMRGFSLDD
jgi:hypothetical protein